MTSERLLCSGNAKFVSSTMPISEGSMTVFSKSSCDNGCVNTRDPNERVFVPEKRQSTVERLLNSLKLSPRSRRNVLENDRFIGTGDRRRENHVTTNANGRSTNAHLSSFVNHKHATISTKDRSSSESGSRHDSYDSLSDSTYSQSSDMSFNSDIRSLNTTSTDSDNNRIFHQGIPRRNGLAFKRSCDVIDVDEGFLKRVLMLMKVVLYLRHNFPLSIIRKRKVFPEISARNQTKLRDDSSLSSSSSDAAQSSETNGFGGKSPRSQKRISFSPTTLLFSAVTEKAFAEAKAILEDEDIDVNAQTPSGQSLLHIAGANADLKCVQLLLQYGAKVNVKDANGWSPLHAAIRRGNWKCAILLIEAGADFAEYAQTRIQEYNQVLQMSRTCFRSVEIFV